MYEQRADSYTAVQICTHSLHKSRVKTLKKVDENSSDEVEVGEEQEETKYGGEGEKKVRQERKSNRIKQRKEKVVMETM